MLRIQTDRIFGSDRLFTRPFVEALADLVADASAHGIGLLRQGGAIIFVMGDLRAHIDALIKFAVPHALGELADPLVAAIAYR